MLPYLVTVLSPHLISLLTVLMLEIPVFAMMLRGSDNLFTLLGHSGSQLLVALVPVFSAISGSIAFQAAQATKSAIVHNHLRSDTFISWLSIEVGVACCHGAVIGILIGGATTLFNFHSPNDIERALPAALMIAQLLSAVTAAIFGIISPIFSRFFGAQFAKLLPKWFRDSIPMTIVERVFFDVLSAFVIMIVCYQLLQTQTTWFGLSLENGLPVEESSVSMLDDGGKKLGVAGKVGNVLVRKLKILQNNKQ